MLKCQPIIEDTLQSWLVRVSASLCTWCCSFKWFMCNFWLGWYTTSSAGPEKFGNLGKISSGAPLHHSQFHVFKILFLLSQKTEETEEKAWRKKQVIKIQYKWGTVQTDYLKASEWHLSLTHCQPLCKTTSNSFHVAMWVLCPLAILMNLQQVACTFLVL